MKKQSNPIFNYGYKKFLSIPIMFWLVALNSSVQSCDAQDSIGRKGLWLTERKFPLNQSRSDIKGNIKEAPKEIWRYGHQQRTLEFASPVTIDNKQYHLVATGVSLDLIAPDGRKVWPEAFVGASKLIDVISGKTGPRALVSQNYNTVIFIDILTGKKLWSWTIPNDTHAFFCSKVQKIAGKNRLFIFPGGATKSTYGYCFEFSDDKSEPELLWKHNYQGKFYPNYGPLYVLADMDNDGKQEVVIAGKPAYVGVIDSDTGQIKFELKYKVKDDESGSFGRPYGLLHVTDLDGDGFKDVVMASCQVEEYIGVLQNINGKSFKFLWSQFIEKDFPDNDREFHPDITSIADVNGDGKKEFIIGLYNMTGDKKWHTLILDPMKGIDSPIVDLQDRYFAACYDINADGIAEIITYVAPNRRLEEFNTIEVIDGHNGKTITKLENAMLQYSDQIIAKPTDWQADAIDYLALRNTPLKIRTKTGADGLIIRRNNSEGEEIWYLNSKGHVFEPFKTTILSRTVIAHKRIEQSVPLDLKIVYDDMFSEGPSALGALVSSFEGNKELVIALNDDKIVGGIPDFSNSGHFKKKWSIQGTRPAVWLGPKERRIVCTSDAEEDVIWLYEPNFTDALEKPVKITLPMEMYRPLPLMPYGKEEFRILVAMHLGPHTMASAVYDENAKQIWQDLKHGPYPGQAAAADIDGDGKAEVVIDDHGQQFIYQQDGSSKMFAAAWSSNRGGGSAYAMPIIGPFGPDGQTRIVMSAGLRVLEIIDVNGLRLAKETFLDDLYKFQKCTAAVAQLRGPGKWDIGMVDVSGIFHCADAITAKTRWTLDLGTRIFGFTKTHVVSGDINSDGRDEFVVGLPNGQLVAIAENPNTGNGYLLWKKKFNASITDNIIADADGDGLAEIVVTTADGFVRILK